MISGTYEFQGLNPLFPAWLLILVLLVAIVVTIVTYRPYKSISGKQKIYLIGLRVSAFLILILLLSNPVIIQSVKVEIKPQVAILIDNSASISIEKGNWSGKESMNKVLSEKILRTYDDFNYTLFEFSSTLTEVSDLEEFTFDDGSTDIDKVISEIQANDEFNQVILFSDGISTRGRDPSFSGLNSRIPITTIAVGDTSYQRDLVLVNVDYPPVAYVNSVLRITATVRNEGFQKEIVQVGLCQNNRLLDIKPLSFDEARSTHQITFDIEIDNEGQQQYEIKVSSLPEEWNLENNSRTISIDVQDDRVRVLYLAFEVHPDVGAFKNVLFENPAIYLEERTWIEGTRFIEGTLPQISDTMDVVIVHGYPEAASQELSLQIREIITNNSFLFVLTPGASINRFKSIISTGSLFDYSENRTSRAIQLLPSSTTAGHVITDIDEIDWGRSPVVSSSVAISEIDQRNQIILDGFNRSNGQSQPALFVTQNGNYRNSFILFSGLYNWFLAEDPYKLTMDNLLTNTVTWTATDNLADLFGISTSEVEYSLSDEILFSAWVKNESGQPENAASISVDVINESDERSTFTLTPSGVGNYSLSIPTLPIGNYRYEAVATKEQSQLGEKSGFFSIGRSSVEYVETRRNDNVLNAIANNSGGEFYVYDEMPDLSSIVKGENKIIAEQTVRQAKMINRNPIWFILLIIIVGFEWYLRKKILLP